MADEDDVQKWLVAWFGSRATLPFSAEDDLTDINYFEAGLIDSFGVVELIGAVEEAFGIRFNEDHFQDRAFSTIGGLSSIVAALSSQR